MENYIMQKNYTAADKVLPKSAGKSLYDLA